MLGIQETGVGHGTPGQAEKAGAAALRQKKRAADGPDGGKGSI